MDARVKPGLAGLPHETGALWALAGRNGQPIGNRSGAIQEPTRKPGPVPGWFPDGTRWDPHLLPVVSGNDPEGPNVVR